MAHFFFMILCAACTFVSYAMEPYIAKEGMVHSSRKEGHYYSPRSSSPPLRRSPLGSPHSPLGSPQSPRAVRSPELPVQGRISPVIQEESIFNYVGKGRTSLCTELYKISEDGSLTKFSYAGSDQEKATAEKNIPLAQSAVVAVAISPSSSPDEQASHIPSLPLLHALPLPLIADEIAGSHQEVAPFHILSEGYGSLGNMLKKGEFDTSSDSDEEHEEPYEQKMQYTSSPTSHPIKIPVHRPRASSYDHDKPISKAPIVQVAPRQTKSEPRKTTVKKLLTTQPQVAPPTVPLISVQPMYSKLFPIQEEDTYMLFE